MTPFILSLVISFVGSGFKVFIMSWYKCMTQFLENIQMVIKKYLCQCHASFPGSDYISNEEVSSGMSK